MKTTATILILLISTFNTKAQQPWAQPGATWHYSYESFFYTGYEKTEKINDTIINAINCDQYLVTTYIYDLVSGTLNIQYDSAYTYIQNDSLYRWVNGQFFLLASINANVGDTWLIADAGNCGTDSSYFYVDSVGQTIIMNDTLGTLYLTAHLAYSTNSFPVTLTEKLGFDIAMFPYWSCMIDYFFVGPFRCYSDNSGFGYSSNIVPYCNYTTAIKEIATPKQVIQIVANPADHSLLILNNNRQSGFITFYDSFGREVIKEEIKEYAAKIKVSITGKHQGVYFWRFQSNGKLLCRGKTFFPEG